MIEVARTAHDMISGMSPVIRPGRFVFITTDDPVLGASLAAQAISIFREDEGLSLLVPVELAAREKLNVDQPMRWIALNVYSSLGGVGLTASVSKALADNNIPCNMVAAFHHDHVFVPETLCQSALQILTSLQNVAASNL